MILLTLDMATRSGWCAGSIGLVPRWGAHDFGRNKSNGEVLSAYGIWLNGKLDEIGPEVVAFESPYMPTGGFHFEVPANALTIRRLFAFAGITEAICHRRRVRVYEMRPSEITRRFLGGPAPRGRERKKAATVAMCHRLGLAVADDDEGDAVALWCVAEGVFEPAMISRRRAGAGIELDLHGSQKTSAPRRSPRGAGRNPSTEERASENGFTRKNDISETGELQLALG